MSTISSRSFLKLYGPRFSPKLPKPPTSPHTLSIQSRCIQNTAGRILFFGSDDFSLKSLEKLQELKQDSSSIVSAIDVVVPPDQRRSKNAKPTPVPVKLFANENDMKIYEVPAGIGPLGLRRSGWQCPNNYDLGVVVSFGYFIPSETLNSLTCGAINVHPSLLPAYRGAAPIPWSILRGEHKTGVSVIEVHPRAFDAGDMLLQVEEDLFEDTTESELRDHLAELGSNCLVAAIRNLEIGMRPQIKQSDAKGCTSVQAPKLSKSHGVVRWSKGRESLVCGDLDLYAPVSSRALYNRWRALGESVGIWAGWKRGEEVVELKLVELERPVAKMPDIDTSNVLPGNFFYSKQLKRIMIRCNADNSDWSSDRDKLWVPCASVQLPGKKVISCTDFVNGQRLANKWPQSFA